MRLPMLVTFLISSILLSTNVIDGYRSSRRSHSLSHHRRENNAFPESCVAGLITGSWIGCAVDLGKFIWSLHTWGDDQPIKRCALDCTGNLKGRVSKLEWVWDGKFKCEGRAPGIEGEGSGFKSRQGAMEKAIEEFIVKAIAAGKLKAEDFKC